MVEYFQFFCQCKLVKGLGLSELLFQGEGMAACCLQWEQNTFWLWRQKNPLETNFDRTSPGMSSWKGLQPPHQALYFHVFSDQPLLEWTHSCRKFPFGWTCIFRKLLSSFRCVLWRQLWETQSPQFPLDVGIPSRLLTRPSMLPLFILQNPLSFTQELGHGKAGTSFPAHSQPCAEPPPAQECLLWLRLSLFVVDVN